MSPPLSQHVPPPHPPRGKVTVIGTAHVLDIRDALKREVLRRKPEVVALELDAARYHGLVRNARGATDARAGTKGIPLMYRVLGKVQERIAADLGTRAGDEMLAAAEAASLLGARVALIDVDAQRALARVWATMGFRERLRFLASLVGGAFARGKDLEDEVERMQSDYTAYLEELGLQFPTVKRVLIDERNEHMAERLAALATTHASIVAVLGDGHVDGVRSLLESRGLPTETVPLKELERAGSGSATASFRVDVEW